MVEMGILLDTAIRRNVMNLDISIEDTQDILKEKL